MQIELGEYYKTHNGQKARPLQYYTCPEGRKYILGVIYDEESDRWDGMTWDERGTDNQFPSDSIISEWRELIKVEGWCNVFRDPYTSSGSFTSQVYASREEADRWKTSRSVDGYEERVACIKVTGVEGEE